MSLVTVNYRGPAHALIDLMSGRIPCAASTSDCGNAQYRP